MRFSIGRMMGYLTLGCITLGCALTGLETGGKSSFTPMFAVLLGPFLAASLWAALDPWVPCPRSMDEKLHDHDGSPRTSWLTVSSAMIIGLLFGFLGGLGAFLFVDNNLTMDSGGASAAEFIRGSGVIASAALGGMARGICLACFLELLCGYRIGSRSRGWFGLCFGSMLALLAWPFTGDLRGTNASWISMGLLLLSWLVFCFAIPPVVGFARIPPRTSKVFASRSRRWGARAFLAGAGVGVVLSYMPLFERPLRFSPPDSHLFNAIIFATLFASLFVALGAEETEGDLKS